MNYKYLKAFFLLVSTIIISGCVSNPMSSKSSSNDNIKKLSIQDISDEGLYSKADDDMGLYDFNFYKISDSSIVGFKRALDNITEESKDYCGDKKRSAFIGDKVKPKPVMFRLDGSIGVFSDSVSVIFGCIDSQYTKDNQNVQNRLEELAVEGEEKFNKLAKVLEADKARIDRNMQGIANSINAGTAAMAESMQRQNEINQMKRTNTNCTVIGNQINCNSY